MNEILQIGRPANGDRRSSQRPKTRPFRKRNHGSYPYAATLETLAVGRGIRQTQLRRALFGRHARSTSLHNAAGRSPEDAANCPR